LIDAILEGIYIDINDEHLEKEACSINVTLNRIIIDDINEPS